ncbi:Glycosylphosphatidylinositol specific phospholipase D1 [Borealophlyctis nickersoniae]|nr:Glycosylphosphatidylinositol specific phospholipase D1 [Borealophlyctis nickersoniae]
MTCNTLHHYCRQGVWKVPTADLVAIYALNNMTVTEQQLTKCMALGYVGAQANRLFGKYLNPLRAASSPFLVENYYNYFRGGVNDMASWASICWTAAVEWLEHGAKGPLCKNLDRNWTHPPRHHHLSETTVAPKLFRRMGNEAVVDVEEGGMTTIGFRWSLWRSLYDGMDMRSLLPQGDTTKKGDGPESAFTSPKPPDTFCTRHAPEHFCTMVSTLAGLALDMFREMYVVLDAALNPFTTQSCSKVPRDSIVIETNIDFAGLGKSLAKGDFDDDGKMDLVIGAPGHPSPIDSTPQTGAVYIIPGGRRPASGPIHTLPNTTLLHGDPAAPFSRFGTSLAIIDLNEDGIDDLAVSAPVHGAQHLFYDGRVYVFFGQRGRGLRADGRWDAMIEAVQKKPDHKPGKPYKFRMTVLGQHLSGVDVDGDGYKDLVIGSPGAGWVKNGHQLGAIHVFLASSLHHGNLTTSDADWSISSPNPQDYESFGASTAVVGDGHGGRTLVIGAPGFRPSFTSRNVGRIYGFDLNDGGGRPGLRFTVTGGADFMQFGR